MSLPVDASAFPVGGPDISYDDPLAGETELWVVVGDLPAMGFETDDAPTPALALQLYCAIAQDWADNVLAGGDLSQSYPIAAEPTPEHARMLLSRIAFLRQEFVSRA